VRLFQTSAFFSLITAFLVSAPVTQAFAQDPCGGFKWDVSKERALFATSARATPAGKDAAAAPVIEPNRLYQVQLLPQAQVAFSLPPGKQQSADGSYAGLAALKIPKSGSYRIALDSGFWVDVVAGGKLVPAKDYEGQHECNAPHKIVEFDLDNQGPLLLQFSGVSQAAVRLTVTRVMVR
jgi:hypothetical protein